MGYGLILVTENGKTLQEKAQQSHYNNLKTKITWAAVLTIPIVVIGMFIMDMTFAKEWLTTVLD